MRLSHINKEQMFITKIVDCKARCDYVSMISAYKIIIKI